MFLVLDISNDFRGEALSSRVRKNNKVLVWKLFLTRINTSYGFQYKKTA